MRRSEVNVVANKNSFSDSDRKAQAESSPVTNGRSTMALLLRCLLRVLPLTLSLVPPAAQAAPWTGILDPARAVDWSGAGIVGGPGGIPGGIPARTALCATLSSPGTSVD